MAPGRRCRVAGVVAAVTAWGTDEPGGAARLRGVSARTERPFAPNDVWRGLLTSCHQTEFHLSRSRRYFPVDLSIDTIDLATGAMTVTFVTHFDHSFYELQGTYEASTRRLYLTGTRGTFGQAWEPCDAEGYVSPDFTTFAGVSVCEPPHAKCDPGGGEFTLRRDRTQFVVQGAGDSAVNGRYAATAPRVAPTVDQAKRSSSSSGVSRVATALKRDAGVNPSSSSKTRKKQRVGVNPVAKRTTDESTEDFSPHLAARAYDGAPVYLQQCDTKQHRGAADDADDDDALAAAPKAPRCDPDDPFAMVHELVGQFGFWRIQRNSTIGARDPDLRYVACSEDVYPPATGWRPVDATVAPPPLVAPLVASMYDLRTDARWPGVAAASSSGVWGSGRGGAAGDPHDELRSQTRRDARALSVALLVALGGLLWALVLLLMRSRVRLKLGLN
mmetsp:Transcript_12212/g.49171  ORF Transcript_12212/g.49171 Transcript_12212/m.49171 type:complete len:444 (-) Transcript_12212:124-1455(-)